MQSTTVKLKMGHCYGTVEIKTANWVNSILDKFKKKSYDKAPNDTGAKLSRSLIDYEILSLVCPNKSGLVKYYRLKKGLYQIEIDKFTIS